MKNVPAPRIFPGIALMVALGAPVEASTTYTYTGNDFTSASSPFTTSDFIQGSFTIAAPLADNLTLATISPTTYTFTDVVSTITQLNGTINDFEVSTNASGAIIAWEIQITIPGAAEIETTNDYAEVGDQGEITGVAGGNMNDPGTWVPEPGTFVPILSGLLALTWLARKRKFQGHRPTPQLLR